MRMKCRMCSEVVQKVVFLLSLLRLCATFHSHWNHFDSGIEGHHGNAYQPYKRWHAHASEVDAANSWNSLERWKPVRNSDSSTNQRRQYNAAERERRGMEHQAHWDVHPQDQRESNSVHQPRYPNWYDHSSRDYATYAPFASAHHQPHPLWPESHYVTHGNLHRRERSADPRLYRSDQDKNVQRFRQKYDRHDASRLGDFRYLETVQRYSRKKDHHDGRVLRKIDREKWPHRRINDNDQIARKVDSEHRFRRENKRTVRISRTNHYRSPQIGDRNQRSDRGDQKRKSHQRDYHDNGPRRTANAYYRLFRTADHDQKFRQTEDRDQTSTAAGDRTRISPQVKNLFSLDDRDRSFPAQDADGLHRDDSSNQHRMMLSSEQETKDSLGSNADLVDQHATDKLWDGVDQDFAGGAWPGVPDDQEPRAGPVDGGIWNDQSYTESASRDPYADEELLEHSGDWQGVDNIHERQRWHKPNNNVNFEDQLQNDLEHDDYKNDVEHDLEDVWYEGDYEDSPNAPWHELENEGQEAPEQLEPSKDKSTDDALETTIRVNNEERPFTGSHGEASEILPNKMGDSMVKNKEQDFLQRHSTVENQRSQEQSSEESSSQSSSGAGMENHSPSPTILEERPVMNPQIALLDPENREESFGLDNAVLDSKQNTPFEAPTAENLGSSGLAHESRFLKQASDLEQAKLHIENDPEIGVQRKERYLKLSSLNSNQTNVTFNAEGVPHRINQEIVRTHKHIERNSIPDQIRKLFPGPIDVENLKRALHSYLKTVDLEEGYVDRTHSLVPHSKHDTRNLKQDLIGHNEQIVDATDSFTSSLSQLSGLSIPWSLDLSKNNSIFIYLPEESIPIFFHYYNSIPSFGPEDIVDPLSSFGSLKDDPSVHTDSPHFPEDKNSETNDNTIEDRHAPLQVSDKKTDLRLRQESFLEPVVSNSASDSEDVFIDQSTGKSQVATGKSNNDVSRFKSDAESSEEDDLSSPKISTESISHEEDESYILN